MPDLPTSPPGASAGPLPPTWPLRDAEHLLVSSGQMAALEEDLFASGLPVESLMEKAALAVSQWLLAQERPLLQRHGAVVLVGPGHNGGDGLVVARELHLAGLPVAIWSPFERHKPITARHLDHARWLGIPLVQDPPDPGQPALWIDALFGIGQQRAPEEPLLELLGERQAAAPEGLVAIDVPTGLCADTGSCLGRHAAQARVTLCIGLIKQGLLQDRALRWVGRLERLDLGLPQGLLSTLPPRQPLGLAAGDLAAAPWPRPDAAAAKYGRGRLLLVVGSPRYPGAAALALGGASASGCGSLQAALPQSVASSLWQTAPHVVVRRQLLGDPEGHLELADLEPADLERLDAVLLGPGIGPAVREREGSRPEQAIWSRLQQMAPLLVIDADGLNRLAQRPEGAGAWLRQRRGPTWLTPHAGEFARLFPHLADLPPLEAAPAAADSTGTCVLLKGAHSVLAGPDGCCWQLRQTSPWAARAGLGDVLAGYAAGLGALGLASGEGAGADLLATAALAHASSGLHLARAGQGCASPGAVAAALARIRPGEPGQARGQSEPEHSKD